MNGWILSKGLTLDFNLQIAPLCADKMREKYFFFSGMT